ncbi:MAG: methyltransferase [Cytophagales bacterium]|nr:methyltransferase [Cytophagales bacterium]MDW8385129.1 methyltransferase [Flammeovirgaceae bacterium]
MANTFFQFKQFRVEHSKCAMKVNTDSCILGAFAHVENPCRILDIGTGSGVIALMLAQRYQNTLIDGVEIEPNAAHQAKENFARSLWADRLYVWNESIQEYAKTREHHYDMIVSNPPYFTNSTPCRDSSSNVARHSIHLTQYDLAKCVQRLLTSSGRFFVIFPVYIATQFEQIAQKFQLFSHTRLFIADNPTRPYNRVISVYSKKRTSYVQEKYLEIKERDGNYSDDFISLMKPYYFYL